MDKLAKDPRFLYSNDDDGRKAALAEYKHLIDAALSHCGQLRPGAYYEPGVIDGSRPGIFFANLREINEVPKWSMPTLSYHEGVPGHHWQISIAHELKGLPQFRKVIPFTAYMEGWALYSEWLAKQAGWYEGDPFGDLGRQRCNIFNESPSARHLMTRR